MSLWVFQNLRISFWHVQQDLVWSLPDSNGHCYVLVCLVCFTWWPEAVLVIEITAEVMALAFVEPCKETKVIPQLLLRMVDSRSNLDFSVVLPHCYDLQNSERRLLPTAKGLKGRFRWLLKSSLSAENFLQWADSLPFVSLGIRDSVKTDVGYCAAQLV